MRLEAALRGNLQRFMVEELRTVETAVTRGVHATTENTKGALRGDIVSAGLGNRLSKSWKSRLYPKGGTSLGTAGVVYSKAPHIIDAFDTGALIRAKSGMWLAIPTSFAPKGRGGSRITPDKWPEKRFGPLRFVFRENGPSLLVVDNQRLAKGKKRTSMFALSRNKRQLRTKKDLWSNVPMFWMVKQTRLRKRLNVQAVAGREAARMAELIDREFWRLDKAGRS